MYCRYPIGGAISKTSAKIPELPIRGKADFLGLLVEGHRSHRIAKVNLKSST